MPLKIKVKAGSVTNLTDARFFSAYEVDYLGFCFDPSSPNYISPALAAQIRSWITGPKIVAEFANQDKDNVLNIIEFFNPDLVELGDEYFIPENIHSALSDRPVIRKTSIRNLKDISAERLQFILIDDYDGIDPIPQSFVPLMIDITDAKSTVLNPLISAIQVKGSPEEVVGVKSYDALAGLFESLLID